MTTTATSRVAALAALIALGLAGCTAAAEPSPTPDNSPAAQTDAEGPTDAYPEDDFVPLEFVTDEYGSYTRMTVDPDSPLLRVGDDPAVQELLAAGATREQLDAAQRHAVTYLVEQYLDGTRLDNFSQDEAEWYAEHADGAFSFPYSGEKSLLLSGYTLTDVAPEPLNRTGAQRFALTLEPLEPLASQDDTGLWFGIGTVYDATAESTDELMLAAVVRNTGLSEAEIVERVPALGDADPAAELLIAGHQWFFVRLDHGKLTTIQGSTNIYESTSGLSLYDLESIDERDTTEYHWPEP